jgi:4-carboxymuconolactone decarboxylase
MKMKSERYQKGLKLFEDLMGKGKGDEIVNAFSEVSPDMADLAMEWGFHDIYSRPGLDLKHREMITIASLVTLGHSLPELKAHIEGGLNAGVTKTEIVEMIMQLSLYCGFPAAINGLLVAKEVFIERKL